MLSKMQRTVLFLILLIGLTIVYGRAPAAETKAKKQSKKNFTHVIANRTDYYVTGPQQGRPADGTFEAGTKVVLLRKAGSYCQVQAENDVAAYVASDALKPIGGNAVKVTKTVREVAQSSNELAFDLYKHLKDGDGNFFFSPASISTALAMAYAGAEGQTERQMAQVLHFDLEEQPLHEGFGTLGQILNSSGKGYQLNMANRLWGQKSYPFQPAFLKATKEAYGAELAQVNFAESEQTRQQINAWVEKQTRGKIKDLIPSGSLEPASRLVLTNAIYFKGTWADEFSKEATKKTPFHLSADRQIQVPTMHQMKRFSYAESGELQLLELPYAGEDLSMVVLLPKKKNGLADLETKLSAGKLEQWTKGLRKREVNVYLPKFTLTSKFRLADVLRAMGMTLPFSDEADFSGISTAEELMISEVVHKAFVDVDEEGTEAAAATGAVVRVTAAVPQEPVVFRADHPFLFLIRDNRTGCVLFLGRVINPQP